MSHPHHASIDPVETLSETEAHEHHDHVTPFWPMFWVFMILLVLTALTVWTSNIHEFWIGNTLIEIGPTPHILLALFIATVKAVLVAAYFMHLKYDKPMNTVVVGATIFAVVLFIGLTLADLDARRLNDSVDMQKIVQGGNGHVGPDGHIVRQTLGVVAQAEENARLRRANEGLQGEGEHGADGHGAGDAATDSPGGH